jgi:hypothetical protein
MFASLADVSPAAAHARQPKGRRIGYVSIQICVFLASGSCQAAAGGAMGRPVRHSFSNGESLLGVSLSALFSDR